MNELITKKEAFLGMTLLCFLFIFFLLLVFFEDFSNMCWVDYIIGIVFIIFGIIGLIFFPITIPISTIIFYKTHNKAVKEQLAKNLMEM